jgi:hypothetical protein
VGEGGHFVFALQGYMYVVSSYIATHTVRPSPPTSSSHLQNHHLSINSLALSRSSRVATLPGPPASLPQRKAPTSRGRSLQTLSASTRTASCPPGSYARTHHPASISPRRSGTRISMHSAMSDPIHSRTPRPLGLGLRSTPPSSPEGGSCVSFRLTRHPRLYLWMDNLTRLLGRALTECEGDFRYRVA